MQRSSRVMTQDCTDADLCDAAALVATHAYAPYSKFAVGAAVRTKRGVYTGSNLENAAYGVSICAEVSALAAANSAGDFDIRAIAVVGHPEGNPNAGKKIVTPCGRCRQLIYEASQVSGVDIPVFCCNGDLSAQHTYLISELLPEGFGPSNLGLDVSLYRSKRMHSSSLPKKRSGG